MENKPGIYALELAGRIYVGSSRHVRRRVNRHLNDLRKGAHSNPFLQNAYRVHGEPIASMIAYCREGDLLFYEQRALDSLKPAYNSTPTAGRNLGHRHSPETLERMREAGIRAWQKRPRIVAKEQRDRISAALKGRLFSIETRAKISAAKKGYRHTARAKLNISIAKRGRAMSAETLARRAARNAERKLLIETKDGGAHDNGQSGTTAQS